MFLRCLSWTFCVFLIWTLSSLSHLLVCFLSVVSLFFDSSMFYLSFPGLLFFQAITLTSFYWVPPTIFRQTVDQIFGQVLVQIFGQGFLERGETTNTVGSTVRPEEKQRNLWKHYTPYSMNSLFAEFFKELSGVVFGVCETIWWLFWGHFGVFWEDFEGKTIQKTKTNDRNLIFHYSNIALNSLLNE